MVPVSMLSSIPSLPAASGKLSRQTSEEKATPEATPAADANADAADDWAPDQQPASGAGAAGSQPAVKNLEASSSSQHAGLSGPAVRPSRQPPLLVHQPHDASQRIAARMEDWDDALAGGE